MSHTHPAPVPRAPRTTSTGRATPLVLPVVKLVAIVACLVAAAPAGAAAYDGFDYPVNSRPRQEISDPDTWAGGTGFGPAGWRGSGGFSTARAGSLSDPTGTLATSGNRVEGTGPFSLARVIGDQPGVTGGEFWVSFLMRRSAPGPDPLFGSSAMLIAPSAFGSRAFFIGEPASNVADGFLAIGNGNDPQAVSTGVPFVAGRDYFLVTRIQLREGNDPATLWVDPIPGVTPTGGGTTFTLSDLGASFPLLTLISTSGATASFDEVRTGASYADVAPVVPEPAAPLAAAFVLLTTFGRRRRR